MSPSSRDDLPRSLAIAGAWGYIGRKFLDVALAHGLRTWVHDPGPAPPEIDLTRLTRVEDEASFYRLPAELFHLALHPEHRRLDLLLARGEPLLILNEKPMSLPERPDLCRQVIAAVETAPATVLYDFPELFDPLTARILDHLRGCRDVRLTELILQRSKDREDPSNPRNRKRMVPIQYQETVHCLAFVLYVHGTFQGNVQDVLNHGVRLRGESEPYVPPNPEAYARKVDGRCRYHVWLGGVRIEGLTDFKRGAEWAKRRTLRGLADGRPFEIEVSYLEGRKFLRLDGIEQPCDPAANSYESVLTTLRRWSLQFDRDRLMSGLFPNPRFARWTYQLSSALWRSCRDRAEVAFHSAAELDRYDADYARE